MRTALSVVFTLWPPGPDERKTSILRSLRLDLDVDLLGLGQHGDGGGGRVNAPLRLGGGHPLDAMHAGLAPQQPEGLGPPHRDDGLLDPAQRAVAQGHRLPAQIRGAPRSADTCGRDRPRRARPRRPPVPARISMMASRSSCGSRGDEQLVELARERGRSPRAGGQVGLGQRGKLGIRLIGELPSLVQFAFAAGPAGRPRRTIGASRACSRPSDCSCAGSRATAGSARSRSTSAARCSAWRSRASMPYALGGGRRLRLILPAEPIDPTGGVHQALACR